VTPIPDWLVERAALDEVSPASRPRVDAADSGELAARVAALRAENAAELAAHPPSVAVAQIERRIDAARTALTARERRQRWLWIGALTSAAAVATAFVVIDRSVTAGVVAEETDEVTRVKGGTRLVAYRHNGDRVERLEQGALVRAGDLIQLRYHPGGRSYGLIASLDGAGVVTLHHPASEDAPPSATALASRSATLPHAYALDDAPRFERFFFVTSDAPIDVAQTIAAVRALSKRDDSKYAPLELSPGHYQRSLRLRKPDLTP
jgi:hypothetical protein